MATVAALAGAVLPVPTGPMVAGEPTAGNTFGDEPEGPCRVGTAASGPIAEVVACGVSGVLDPGDAPLSL